MVGLRGVDDLGSRPRHVAGDTAILSIVCAAFDLRNTAALFAMTLQAPLAMTTARQRISPWLVVTWYPSSACRTDVTVTPVRTGACETLAKRSMSSVTSPTVM